MPHIGPYYHKKPGFKRIGIWGWNSELLWSKIDQQPDANGCLNWRGAMSPTGALMGAWKFPDATTEEHARQQMSQARRLVWMDINNKDVSEYQVKLTCGNQKCCSAEHFIIKPSNRQPKNDLDTAKPKKSQTKPPQERWWG